MNPSTTLFIAAVPFLSAPSGQLQFIEVQHVNSSRNPGVTMFTAKKWTGRNWSPRSLYALSTPEAEALGIRES